MKSHKRRIKFIHPSLQARLTLVCVGLCATGLVLQFILFTAYLSEIALHLPSDGELLMEQIDVVLLRVLGMSMAVFLPLTFLIGILTSFRIAGPVHRFQEYLRQIIRGEEPGACRIRKGDQLQELCVLLNQAVIVLSEPRADARSSSGPMQESEGEEDVRSAA